MSGSSVQPPAAVKNDWNPERGEGGKFRPGSGGRPLGAKNKTSRDTLGAVQGIASEAVVKLREQVREGNMAAIKIVLEYTLPRGGRTIDFDGTADPNAIIEAMTTGEISPDEFARISQGWKTAADAADLSDIKEQVEALETLITAMRK